MMNDKLKDAVRTIMAKCKKQDNCKGCGLYGENGCLITDSQRSPNNWPDPDELTPEEALAVVSDAMTCGARIGCDGCKAGGILCGVDVVAEVLARRRYIAVLDAAVKRLRELEGKG